MIKPIIDVVAGLECEVFRLPADALAKIKGDLRVIYRALERPSRNPLKDVHATLDDAVLAADGFDPQADLLAQLLALNHAAAAKEKAGEDVTAPGVPPGDGDAPRLVTKDSIKP
ncbi:MAG TPA: hypothetical protein VH475_22385 [Tepidisphaeraceae bacterium]